MSKHRDIHKSYSELLKDPRWREYAARIKAECWSCRECGTEESLQVHHLGYRAGLMPWEYEDDEVMVLCDSCHSELHDYADKIWNESLRSRNKWVIYECAKAVETTIKKNALSEHAILTR
jgi:5-methylcytosine-specific restriction endonuclease McrA